VSADPMIAICDDRRTHRARAISGYFGGAVPVLSRRHQPQRPDAAVPLRHERCGMAGHRARIAGPGVAGGQGRPSGRALPPRHRGRDPLPGQRRHPVACHAVRLPALADRLRHPGRLAGSGATEDMHGELRRQCRIAAGRKPEPTAAVIDSRSVKAAETVAGPGRGYDAGKKINGRKRHIAVDTIGLLLTVLITAAGVQDRDGAKPCCGTCSAHSARSGTSGPIPVMPASSSPGRRRASRSPWRS
jgi:hypothetical protein